MQLFTIICAALASLAIGAETSAVRNKQHDAAKYAQHEGFNPVSPPPKVISARSGDEHSSMSGGIKRAFDAASPPPKVLPPRSVDEEVIGGNTERTFDAVSPPPKVLPPRSEEEDFSMSGVSLPPKHDLLDGQSPTIHGRNDGFIVMSPPLKVISRRFDTISPPPKTRPLDSKLNRRVDIWSLET